VKVEELMTREVATCRSDDMLNRAAELMWNRDCGCVPVVDEEKHVVGMITDRDICMAAYTRGSRLADLRVADAMARQVESCWNTDDIGTAEEMMRTRRVRRLPVLASDRRLAGVLSLNDIAREAARERRLQLGDVTLDEVAGTLAGVCQPHAEVVPSIRRPSRDAAKTAAPMQRT